VAHGALEENHLLLVVWMPHEAALTFNQYDTGRVWRSLDECWMLLQQLVTKNPD
jgi:hypothetical protein